MLSEVCTKHAPYTKLKLRDFAPPWLNTEYLSLVDTREYWFNKLKKSSTDYHLEHNLEAIENCKQLTCELQDIYFTENINDS